MNQHEFVIKTMEEYGGYATLGFLNQNVDVSNWKTKTPFASIRRIVQDERFFFKIRPGLWALKTYKNKLPVNVFPAEKISKIKQEEFNHSYYQGLLVEIGNLKKQETFVPYQDKNKKYLEKSLSEITTIEKFYEFTHKNLLRHAITIDVSWFNKRKMPSYFFEVEHSTDIKNSLNKFVELQDFYTKFYIVADIARKREYDDKLESSAFNSVQSRVDFIDYESLSNWHTKSFEVYELENNFRF
ncbi:MAG: hypothetical protein KAQ87_04800 [Candidatus Pacebacteria bacterium]|nr:hypothetical protein [Candidatus Paceibacterota bacterium]